MKYLIFMFICIIIIMIIINNQQCDILTNNNLTLCNNKFNTQLDILSFINGYWISNEEFNNASDIDKMILYIDYINNTAKLVIINNNQIISNDEYQIYIDDDNVKYTPSGTKCNTSKSRVSGSNGDLITKFNITFIPKSISNGESDNIWSNKIFNCILNINTGNIKLIDEQNKTVFGDLFKDNMISNFINSI